MIPPQRSPAQSLLEANTKWADAVNNAEPGFFPKLAEGQQPKVLWMGCADSRVPESVITGARPGDIFVHRNIANQIHPDDSSAEAVLSYAIGVVGAEHVVLAGHTHCGGAVACYDAVSKAKGDPSKAKIEPETPFSRWLGPLTSLAASLDLSNAKPSEAIDLIVEANVRRQVEHICASGPVQQAWAAGKPIWVHGWVVDIASGRIKDLGVSRGPGGIA